MTTRDEANKLISRIYRLGFDNARSEGMAHLHAIGQEYMQASERLLALICPPAPAAITEAMVERGARTMRDCIQKCGVDAAWPDPDEWGEKATYLHDARVILEAALAAAQAQPGGEATDE